MSVPLVMGVLNVTPDSFYDGGRYFGHAEAVACGMQMAGAGADVIDVGGESTRPGASAVPAGEELRRVLPVVEALAGTVRVSIDTMKEEVARAAVRLGASLLNDVSATISNVAADTGVGYVAMHRQGAPGDMQLDPRYVDVVEEVSRFLDERARAANAAGVEEVWIDPGIGFGKTVAHNLALLSAIPKLVELGWPVLIGASRKSFLGHLAPRPDGTPASPGERLEPSLAAAVWSIAAGAGMVRVHDVPETVAAARIISGSGSVSVSASGEP